MRRANHLFERIADRDNLRLAVHKALIGKRSKGDARAFVCRLDDNLDWMRSALLQGDFPVGVYNQFTIFDPKERLITAPCFRERVLHHAIMNLCETVFERWLIADTFACRKNKGRLAALLRAQTFSRRFAFFLKLDIRKYFDSVSHPILLGRLRRLYKEHRLLELFERIITAYESTPCRGLPNGSLTSQHFANFYLGGLDRFVKEQLRVRGYARYMDDCVLWADSSAELRRHLDAVRTFLSVQLDLSLKASPYINRTGHGLDFLGCRVFPSHLVLNRRGRVRFRRKLKTLEHSLLAGQLDEAVLQQRATALVAFTRTPGVSAWSFRRSVINSLPVGGLRPRTG
jgi:RNA-directed DNA polymerase